MAVLFFASFDEMNKQCYSYRKNMSLQVHDPLLARRAHPCTSSLPASMTVEAALVLPLALLFFLALLQPVIWLDRQRKVQTAMERIGEEISQYGILKSERPVPSAGKREMDRRPSISRRQASTITAIKIAGL